MLTDYTPPPKATSVGRGSLACLIFCLSLFFNEAISHGSLASNHHPEQSSPSFDIATLCILSQHLIPKELSGSHANSQTKCGIPSPSYMLSRVSESELQIPSLVAPSRIRSQHHCMPSSQPFSHSVLLRCLGLHVTASTTMDLSFSLNLYCGLIKQTTEQ